jgi:hypothetical protein
MTTYSEKGCPTPEDCSDPHHKHTPEPIESLDGFISKTDERGAVWYGHSRLATHLYPWSEMEYQFITAYITERERLARVDEIRYFAESPDEDIWYIDVTEGFVKDRLTQLQSKEQQDA